MLPKPVIGTATSSEGSLIFSGTNGVPGGTYYILTSTNVAAPLTNWTILSTNYFDANGNFSVTNPISENALSQFYLLRLP